MQKNSNPTPPTLTDAQKRIQSARRYAKKLSWKRKECLELAEYIFDYFTSVGDELPHDKPKKFDFLAPEDVELARLYYVLRGTGRSLYAKFDQGGKTEVVTLATFWSRHRFDSAWLWRKSQILRKRFRELIATNTKLTENYTPCHLTLTVPHKDGLFMGKAFYMKEIKHLFHELRREKFWKKMIIGGEYTTEIKRSPNDNGLHIHIHALVFIKNECSVHEIRRLIYNRWAQFLNYPTLEQVHEAFQKLAKAKLNGNKEEIEDCLAKYLELKKKRLQVDFSTVYYFEKENGRFVMEVYQFYNKKTGLNEDRYRRKKVYFDSTWTVEQYTAAILEVIKYQCKTDNVKDGKVWDVLLIKEILNNSKNARFTDNFGKLYKNLISEKPEPQQETDVEAKPDDANMELGKVELENLINPFTEQPAKFGEYYFAVANPERLAFSSSTDDWLLSTNNRNYQILPRETSLKEAIEAIFPLNYRLAKEKRSQNLSKH